MTFDYVVSLSVLHAEHHFWRALHNATIGSTAWDIALMKPRDSFSFNIHGRAILHGVAVPAQPVKTDSVNVIPRRSQCVCENDVRLYMVPASRYLTYFLCTDPSTTFGHIRQELAVSTTVHRTEYIVPVPLHDDIVLSLHKEH
jgi:hypothetical protein